MDPDDLIIIDYPPLFEPSSSPSTPNPSIDSDDYFIKLNQAWEREVKYRNDVINWLFEMERRWEKINKANVGFGSNESFVMKPDIQPIQQIHKV